MSEERIVLTRTDAFYTQNQADAWRIASGVVYVYIVRWSPEKGTQEGKRVPLCEVGEDHVLPGFAWEDENHQHFRFLVIPRTEKAELEPMPGKANRVLRKKFAAAAGLTNFEQEGYEGSLAEFYRENELKDDIFLARAKKEEPNIARKSFGVMAGAVTGGEAAMQGSGALEKAVRYACKKIGVNLDTEKVRHAALDKMSIPEMARVCDFLCREVVLEQNWQKMDCGVLVGFREGKPCVLYPGKGDHYFLWDPAEDKSLPLKGDILSQLDPKAWTIGRTLPAGAVKKKDLIAFVRKSFRRKDVVAVVILGLLSTLIGVLQPKLNQLIYDDYIALGEPSVVIQVSMVIATFMVGNVFISIVKKLQEYRISSRAGYELQDAVYWRIFDLPENFFRKYDSADLAKRLMGVGQTANGIVSRIVTNAIPAVLSLIYVFQMFKYSSKLSLWGIGMVLLWNTAVFFLSRSTIRRKAKMEKYSGEAMGRLYQFLNGVDKIRMSGAQERAILEYMQPVAGEKQEAIRSNYVEAFAGVLKDIGPTIFSMVLYYIVMQKTGDQSKQITAGQFMAFNTAFGSFSAAIVGLVAAIGEILAMKPSIERVKPVLETPTEEEEGKDEVAALQGEIEVDHVTFGYDEGSTVLNDLSLHIMPGEYVALVGASGCGKSTLLKLLLGFESPRRGRILYDGKDMKGLDKHSLRKKLGVVLQNGKLISGSISDNIAITGSKKDAASIDAVIEDVGLKADIDNMPMGKHTMVNESGGTISGGQQQRILIARAIYSNPAILYFDEATSALDNVTQAKVCASLEKRHMTRVVIAHRLSTVQNCDRIYVLDKGQVVEVGNFESLMAKRGLFYQMASRQIAE